MNEPEQLRSAEEWLKSFHPFPEHNCVCICDRCKNGVETFLLLGDIEQIQHNARQAALTEAIALIKKRADDYDGEHGWTDQETGAREYPKNGDAYMLELYDIHELLAALRDKPSVPTTPTQQIERGEM